MSKLLRVYGLNVATLLLALYVLAPPVASQAAVMLFGSFSGTAKAVAVNTSGAMSVVVSGQAPIALSSSVTQVCTTADTNETDLWNFSLPAGTLATNGQALRFTAMGTYGATANNKTLKLYLGTTSYSTDTTASSAGQWSTVGTIVRTAATTQQALVWGAISGGTFRGGSLSALAETLANALAVKITGTNGTAAANDICFKSGFLEFVK